jgi:L-fuconolactonase
MAAFQRRIDAHHHFWDPIEFDYPWMEGNALDPIRRSYQPGDLEPELLANDIDGTVLIQTVSDITETRQFLDIARMTPFVVGVVGWVDLADPSVADTLDELSETFPNQLVGIRHQVHDEADPNWLGRPDVRNGLAAVWQHGLAYDLLVRTRELPSAVAVARSFPTQQFVLDHIAKPPIADGWSETWSTELGKLAALPNVSVKLSGMVTEARWDDWSPQTLRPYVERVIELFGVDRVMFGSDWPVCLLAAPDYGAVVDALTAVLIGLSSEELEQVFGTTAERCYQLGTASS